MKSHHTIAAMIAALTVLPTLLHAEELLRNGSFEAQLDGWRLDQHDPARATATFGTTDPDGKPAIEIEVVDPGDETWKVQLVQGGFTVSAGKIYTLSFYAKAEPELDAVVAAISQNTNPNYEILAAKEQLTLSPEWKRFDIDLIPRVDEPRARFLFSNLARYPGKIWISQVSLVEND